MESSSTPQAPLLSDERISEIAKGAFEGPPGQRINWAIRDYEDGAHFARDFYEQRIAELQRENADTELRLSQTNAAHALSCAENLKLITQNVELQRENAQLKREVASWIDCCNSCDFNTGDEDNPCPLPVQNGYCEKHDKTRKARSLRERGGGDNATQHDRFP